MKIFVRTVTYHYVGDMQLGLVKLSPNGEFITLRPAWWVADSGPGFADRLLNADYEDMVKYPDGVQINTAAIVDWCNVKKLPE